jgi:AcrR family transcriptional regulator
VEPRSVPGYSKGAPYSNFESNEAIFLELLRHYMERDMAELERAGGWINHPASVSADTVLACGS